MCPDCGAVVRSGDRFCASCGAPVPAAAATHPPRHQAVSGERKVVTILFADTVGSTRLIEHVDPEVAVARLQPVLDAMAAAVHAYGGTVSAVLGDGVLALFGAPITHEDHAVRAAYAALRMPDVPPGRVRAARSVRRRRAETGGAHGDRTGRRSAVRPCVRRLVRRHDRGARRPSRRREGHFEEGLEIARSHDLLYVDALISAHLGGVQAVLGEPNAALCTLDRATGSLA